MKATAAKDEIVSQVNTTANLVCFVTPYDKGNPDSYFFIWTRQGDATFHHNTSFGVFQLTPSSPDDEDTYKCAPENSIGQGLPADIMLWILGK